MIGMTPTWRFVVAALLVAAGFAGGCVIKGRLGAAEVERLHGDIARIKAAHAVEKQAMAEAMTKRLIDANKAERAAVLALHETRARIDVMRKRAKGEMHGLSTANHCGLSAGAIRVLDRAINDAGALPENTPGTPRETAEPATDAAQPAASESAVGAWILDAITLYDECRARIDAIRHWDDVTHGR